MTTKKTLLIIALTIVVAALAGFFTWSNQSQAPAPQPTQDPAQSGQKQWNGVYPGVSFDRTIEEIGPPKKTEGSGSTQVLHYPGINQHWDTEVTVQNKTVTFIREHVFSPQNTSLSSRLAGLSEEPIKLYGRISESGQYIYVSPRNGVALLASEHNDTVYEVWYFSPGELSTVLLLPEFKGYSTNPDNVVGGR